MCNKSDRKNKCFMILFICEYHLYVHPTSEYSRKEADSQI